MMVKKGDSFEITADIEAPAYDILSRIIRKKAKR